MQTAERLSKMNSEDKDLDNRYDGEFRDVHDECYCRHQQEIEALGIHDRKNKCTNPVCYV